MRRSTSAASTAAAGAQHPQHPQLPKTETGIEGFDSITFGGIPTGRPTLICGGPGCGKTLFALTCLVNGATLYDEPGVLMTFEEKKDEIAANAASLGFDIDKLIAEKKLVVDHVHVARSEIEEAGDYDLEGLFVRLDHAIKTVNAKRVVLDTLEALFSGLNNTAVLRAELRRLFAWLKDRGMTAIITAERGEGQLTRHGMEEYVSDCVILLDVVAYEQIVTRRLRVVKYRGSAHGTNEYPFLIDETGISVLPITSASLAHKVMDGIVSSGVPTLDDMLDPGGFYRGSSILYSGGSGTGKTTFAGSFAEAAAERGEKVLYFAFEESPEQIIRNMKSTGIDLEKHVKSGLLKFEASRPSTYGYEMHLARMNRDMDAFQPEVVIVDPLSAFRGSPSEIHGTLMRMVDMLKTRGVTAVFTRLTSTQELHSGTDQGISSLIDTWVLLADLEVDGQRTRGVYLMKSRGMSHSHEVRQYMMTKQGLRVVRGAFAGKALPPTADTPLVPRAAKRVGATPRSKKPRARHRSKK
jgi:circadian clock protein KaiC